MYKKLKSFVRDSLVPILGLAVLGIMMQGLEPVSALENRIISLTGQPNFRDLGGYKTIDGKQVKKGVLYRSGELQKLSHEDVRVLKDLGVKTVVNFLTPEEIEARGKDRLPKGTKVVFEPIEEGNAGELALLVLEARKTGDFSKIPVELNAELHALLIDAGAPSMPH